MLLFECVNKGRSSWLQEGLIYKALGIGNDTYFIKREGFPTGKRYHSKHFVELTPRREFSELYD